MTRSLLHPGKAHNFRVASDASWTESFNRIATRNQWSVNKTMNVLIRSALNMNDMNDDSVTVEITPKELELLLRMRKAEIDTLIVDEEKPVAPIVKQPVEQRVAETPVATEAPKQNERKLTPYEKAKLQQQATSMNK